MKLAVPDLISNSYFPAIAAVELGCFLRKGLDVTLELMVPIETAFAAMRQGSVHLVGASAHLMACGFPEWRGAKLLCALSQGMYWFLVMRADLGLQRGEIGKLGGLRIGGAAPVAMGLRRLLIDAGLDGDGISIAPIPGAHGAGSNFGVIAAQALADGRVDGFWANGMGAEIAVRQGVGTVVLDVRRSDGPPGCFGYTFAALAATTAFIEDHPHAAAGAVRAIGAAHAALRGDPALATRVGRKLFPATEAALIAELVQRDLPFYDTAITPSVIASMLRFSRSVGIVEGDLGAGDVVANLGAAGVAVTATDG